jgi:signal transduction histidine kinase
MKIRLVSRDRHVEKLCREALSRPGRADWSLYLDPHGGLDQVMDLAIVDLDTVGLPPAELEGRNAEPQILLYNEERMDGVRGSLPLACILLKPLRRELFLSVLECVLARLEAGAATLPASGSPVNGNEPAELLQYLLHTNLELQRAYARQMHFLARGLHDLRAPLTAIEGYSGLLLAERFGPLTTSQRDNVRRMQQSITRLSGMASDIFRLSLGERGEEARDLQPGNIEPCIQRVLDEMMPLADAKHIHLTAQVAAPAEALAFHEAQIHSVLTNLLENACRFTPRDGSIELSGYSVFWDRRRPEIRETRAIERRERSSQRPNAYRVDIHDSGPGVPAEHLNSIFEPYTSYAGSQDRAGSGLGLAICRMVIGAHRGRISVESSPAGAVFSFVLPFAEPLDCLESRPPQSEQDRAPWRGQVEETA